MMPKRKIKARSREEMLADYPISDRVPDWYFRIVETSNAAWLVEGSDVWGRKVSMSGGDPEKLLAACVAEAAKILERSGGPK